MPKNRTIRIIHEGEFSPDAAKYAAHVNVPGYGSHFPFHARVKRRRDGHLHRQRFGVALRAVRFTIEMGGFVRVFYECSRVSAVNPHAH